MNKQAEQELLSIVNANYEAVADDFSRTRKRKLWPPLEKIASKTPCGSRILDVGCGNGRLRQAWMGKAVEYVGVDSSNNLLELALKITEWRIDGQKFIKGSVLELDRYGLGLFDEVYCVAVIHHLPGAESRACAIEQLLRCVKPGGKLVVTAWSMWQKPLFIKLVVKNALLKLVGFNHFDFGDIVFPGFDQKSPRYYHAYTKKGFISSFKVKNAVIEELIFDKRNYYAVLRKT